jgi:hypothetical protein
MRVTNRKCSYLTLRAWQKDKTPKQAVSLRPDILSRRQLLNQLCFEEARMERDMSRRRRIAYFATVFHNLAIIGQLAQ